MNQVITWLRSGSSLVGRLFPLRQALTILVGIVLLSLPHSHVQTVTQPLILGAVTSVQIGDVSRFLYAKAEDNSLAAEPQQKLKGAANNVREKLNLDEPLYPPTKEFLDSTQKGPKQAFEKTQEAIKDTSNPVQENRSR